MLEDDIADAELAKYALREGGLDFSFQRVDSQDSFLQELDQTPPDVILSDSALPAFDGRAALRMVQGKRPEIPFIFVTGTMGEEAAIDTLKAGATDYVLKTRLSRLVPAVHRALREAEERRERKLAEERLRDSHEQLRALSVYLQYVREEERSRIAREVHDELGQGLTGLKLDLAWVANRLPKDLKPLLDKAKAMSGQIDVVIAAVRRIATELRPGILDDLGLVAALEWQANEFQIRTGIECRLHTEVRLALLDARLNTAFFRVFQETLTNIIRHAEATRVEVHFTLQNGWLVLEVRDNGRGITSGKVASPESLGLLGMRERATLLGGTFAIQGGPGQGTTVSVRIPLPRTEPNENHRHENSHRRRPRGSAPGSEADPGR